LPENRSFKANNLNTGRPYRFYVVAANSVGYGPASAIASFYACADPI